MPHPVEEFEKYRQELLASLANDDPVAVLRQTLDEVPRLVAAASPERLNRAPAPGEWSPRDVLNHLADSDLVSGTRIRMIVTEDRPTLVGYDQEAWTERFGRLDATVQETVDRWRVLRGANLRLLESLSPEEWDRVGVHTERGPESVRLTVQLAAGHDRVHLDQFRRGMNWPVARTHDMGGRPSDTPLNIAEHALADWEVMADAINGALGARGLRSTDQHRRAMEDMPADDYLALSYYERWVVGTERLLIEQGVLSAAEIDAKMAELAATWNVS
jgi:hypothetical protein